MSGLRMRFPILLLLMLALPCVALAIGDNSQKVLTLHKTDAEITIDGVIDSVWSQADSVSDFFQFAPYYAQPPGRKTVARVLTSAEALYCLMVCYDRRDNIQLLTGVVDQAEGDGVSIMLDTFNDKQSAYKFIVTAAGVRSDARLVDDARDRDYRWDGVWYAASTVYDWGYVVEMKIPYKSIRYAKDLTEWGLDFDRWNPESKEDLYWCEYEQNEQQRVSKFGQLILNGARPAVTGLNLEVYPVAIGKATYQPNGTYDLQGEAGIDVFYNPSEKLTFQLTANPDFAQIEADPFQFNISRYETYYAEQRPFFTEGSEIFTASGREHNSGFYQPLELFYSRRIGKLLPGGVQVPLNVGTKASGRIDDWEYGAFFAATGSASYLENGENVEEPRATFESVRIKKRILTNSSVGVLFVGKQSAGNFDGVIDLDGAFRGPAWQLAYQAARSMKNGEGDYAGSLGFRLETSGSLTAVRLRGVGKRFEIEQVGFVPWLGTVEFVAFSGPLWRYDTGPVQQILLGGGPGLFYKDDELYTDRLALLIFNMQFRANWGFEWDLVYGTAKDRGIIYPTWSVQLGSWFGWSTQWEAHLNAAIERSYNFGREYLALDGYVSPEIGWKPFHFMEVGTTVGVYIEGNPEGKTEEITYNYRPYFSITPFNDLNFRVYVDNLHLWSTGQRENMIIGFLFSYNFLPKSWIYLAINEVRDRNGIDEQGNYMRTSLQTRDRVGVLKVKYLYFL
jgi:hypothetical protein